MNHFQLFVDSWLQDDRDYGVVEVELYMDRMEKENSVLQKQDLNTVEETPRGAMRN